MKTLRIKLSEFEQLSKPSIDELLNAWKIIRSLKPKEALIHFNQQDSNKR